MIAFLKLIRFPNLLIIALTQYLTRYCLLVEYYLIDSKIETHHIDFTLNNLDFFLLVLSTMLVAAGGYIINDYFDTKTDAVNKPEKVIIGKDISRRSAILFHIITSGLAIIIGIYISIKIGVYKLSLLNILAVGLLWFYSTTYKKTFIVGNFIVALLTALVPLIVGVFEPKIYTKLDSNFGYILGYASFAFIVSLIREIIKDVEDMKGDTLIKSKTIPIVLGVKISKIIVVLLSLSTISFLAFIQYLQYLSDDMLSFWYFMLALQLPFFFLIYNLIKAKDKSDYAKISLVTKIIMVLGVLSMLIFYYSL